MNIAIKISRKPLFLSLFSSLATSSSSSLAASNKPCKKKQLSPPPSPSMSISDYLVKNLSFSRSEAESLSSKCRLTAVTTHNPDAVISFLRSEAHLSPSQLRRFLRLRPSFLSSNVHSTLLPKLHLLRSLLPPDSPPKDLAALVSSCASCFAYSPSRLSPAISLLRSLLLHDDKKVVSALRRYPRLLTNDPVKVLSRNADLLRARGLGDPDRLAGFIDKSPLVLSLSPLRLDSAFNVVKREFGLDMSWPESANDCISAVNLAASLTEEGFLERVKTLRRFGFWNSQMLVLFRRCPNFMKLNHDYMVKKLEFFREEVGMGPKDMIYNAWIPMFSVEKRLRPRLKLVQGLKEKGLVSGELDMHKVFLMTDEKFDNEFADKFKDGEVSRDLVRRYLSSLEANKKIATSK